jgi:hypothetical protein
MKNRRSKIFLSLLLVLVAGLCFAQRGWNSFSSDRRGVPAWEVSKEMPNDVFTFARIEYDSGGGRRGSRWTTDYPDADLNLSYRLNEMTSMEVNPNGAVMRLTDDELFDHPFIYIVEPGSLSFSSEEVNRLRRYCNNGGFLMIDDFWGEAEWDNLYYELKRVFPEREPQSLPLEHTIFHAVFPLKERPQVPSINTFYRGRTYERPDATEVHYKGIYDDKGRLMVVICHNTDLGDGWEREGEDPEYFKQMSEKSAYPLGINILYYSMSH